MEGTGGGRKDRQRCKPSEQAQKAGGDAAQGWPESHGRMKGKCPPSEEEEATGEEESAGSRGERKTTKRLGMRGVRKRYDIREAEAGREEGKNPQITKRSCPRDVLTTCKF